MNKPLVLYVGGNNGGFSSFKMTGDLLPISGFSSNSSWKITGIPLERNDRRSSSSPATKTTQHKHIHYLMFNYVR